MKRGNESQHKKSQTESFWQSYSDMMGALILVFILVLACTMYQAQAYYEKTQEEIIDLNGQLTDVLGKKEEIIDKLKKAVEGSFSGVAIDPDTGAISFDSNILFKTSEYELQESGKEFLNEFFPVYMDIVLDEEISPYIAEVIIEGHTDEVNTYLYNLNLSQNRAFAVATYCLDDNTNMFTEEQLEKVRSLVTANGRAFYDLRYNKDGTIDRNASRRVEIQFRLRDDYLVDELKTLVE